MRDRVRCKSVCCISPSYHASSKVAFTRIAVGHRQTYSCFSNTCIGPQKTAETKIIKWSRLLCGEFKLTSLICQILLGTVLQFERKGDIVRFFCTCTSKYPVNKSIDSTIHEAVEALCLAAHIELAGHMGCFTLGRNADGNHHRYAWSKVETVLHQVLDDASLDVAKPYVDVASLYESFVGDNCVDHRTAVLQHLCL